MRTEERVGRQEKEKQQKSRRKSGGGNAGGERGQVAAFKICDAAGLDFGGSAAEKADLVPRVAAG